MEILIFLALVGIGYYFGSHAEKKHYAEIQVREAQMRDLPGVTFRKVPEDKDIEEVLLVTGSVVIAVDYFKVFVAGLRNIFGGRVSSYESLVDRARREAVLRMKDEARRIQADMILNQRIETSNLSEGAGTRSGGAPSIEAMAYGTAVRFRK